MTIIRETLDTFRRVREAGNLDAMLATIGADPAAMMEEAANLAATDATVAEAYIIGTMVARLATMQEQVLLLEVVENYPTPAAATDPTVPTGPRRVRPGIRRSR